MSAKARRYLIFHLSFFLFAVGFAAWAVTMRRLFPNGYYDCFMNDVLHLYCPLCGGTRAVLSLLRLDLAAALRYNLGVFLLLPLALLLELRALRLLYTKGQGAFFPPWVRRFAVVYFVTYGVLRNTALMLGVDLLRDQTAYWQVRLSPWRAALFLPLAVLLCASFYLACYVPKRLARYQFVFVCIAALLPLLILALLHGKAWILLTELLVIAALAAYKICKKSREKGEKIC